MNATGHSKPVARSEAPEGGLARGVRVLLLATVCCAVVFAVLLGLAVVRGGVWAPLAVVGGAAGAGGAIAVAVDVRGSRRRVR